MLNEREMKYRLKCAEDAGIPMTNYGTAIAHMTGILKRSIEILKYLVDVSTTVIISFLLIFVNTFLKISKIFL